MGSDPIQGMDFCVYSMFVLFCVGSGLAMGRSPVQGVLPAVYKTKKTRIPYVPSGSGWMDGWMDGRT
jgi:hypothetical protein